MELHGCNGCGSSAVEALLEMAGVAYRRHVFDWDDQEAWERLRQIQPLAQVPTLVLDDGTVLTESAAIVLWIAEQQTGAGLMPSDPVKRALVYRWIVSFATNIYVPIIVGDFPSRWVDGATSQDSLKSHAMERLRSAWLAFEADIAPAPYLLGAERSVLDIYVAMISRWRPGRAWLTEHCPKAMASVALTEQDPVVASVWARNFPEA